MNLGQYAAISVQSCKQDAIQGPHQERSISSTPTEVHTCRVQLVLPSAKTFQPEMISTMKNDANAVAECRSWSGNTYMKFCWLQLQKSQQKQCSIFLWQQSRETFCRWILGCSVLDPGRHQSALAGLAAAPCLPHLHPTENWGSKLTLQHANIAYLKVIPLLPSTNTLLCLLLFSHPLDEIVEEKNNVFLVQIQFWSTTQ